MATYQEIRQFMDLDEVLDFNDMLAIVGDMQEEQAERAAAEAKRGK